MQSISTVLSNTVACPNRGLPKQGFSPVRPLPRVNKQVTKAEDESTAISVAKTERTKQGTDLWFASEQSLSYLDGSLAGDFGFDPLGLMDPEGAGGFITPEWLRYAEIMNGRWAMLGAAGCIAPELLGKLGVIPEATAIVWWKSGVIPPAGDTDIYWGSSWTIFWLNACLMNFAELRRLQDYKNPGSMSKQGLLGIEKLMAGSGDPAYPGGPFFNFMGLGKTEESMKNLKTKEIKNGRLAMLAMFGFGAQAVLTRQGPVDNLIAHLSDPINNNIIANFGKVFGEL
eukprot:TRINITY_DN1210_c1_g1_i3.p1 TRINITY_DN1210_c1_g1~~TRINITY_DN1210_c1_g1_i3.p1  ORF type:complete len:325 (-),score=74.27 TRINITY_DN1210_c1_g1_i3:194-1048(-)